MYCPTCGTQLTKELAYCPRCGANLAPTERAPKASPARLTGATWALALSTTLVALGGIALLFIFAMTALTRRIEPTPGVAFMMFLLAAVTVVVASVLGWQLSRVVRLYKDADDEPAAKQSKQRLAADRPAPALLDAAREPVASVTEHTTRTFEPVPRERHTR